EGEHPYPASKNKTLTTHRINPLCGCVKRSHVMELMTAHHQWTSRPADQRFQTLAALKASVDGRRRRAREVAVKLSDLRFTAPSDASLMVDVRSQDAVPSNWAFGQIASHLKAPAGYLRTLPAPLAMQCLQNGVVNARHGEAARLLVETEDDGEL